MSQRSAAEPPAAGAPDMARVEVVAPNFKQRLSGVTSTIVQLIPLQSQHVGITTFGPGLPDSLPKMRWWQAFSLWMRPASGRKRIWHARRNIEMIGGLVLKALGARLHVIFTSAAQRRHQPFTKWLIRRMEAVIATSGRSGSFLDVPHTVVRHGVDLDAFHPALDAGDAFSAAGIPGKYAIGCFGRVRHQKGTDLFIDAMINLLPRYPEWTAVITGRVTAEHEGFARDLHRKVEQAGLSDRIVFLGEVPDIHQWYRRVSLYVAPSRNEGFGLTPLEAMASAVPVVASDAGAYAEMIVEGETGSIVAAGDGAALQAAIEPYLADPAATQQAGERALDHVRQTFPLEREASEILKVYDGVWARRG